MIMKTDESGRTKPEVLNLRDVPASFIQAQVKDRAAGIPGAVPNLGKPVIPHILTMQGRVGTISRVYPESDEAIQDSKQNARIMRNEPAIMECLEARLRGTALLNWHIEPENENSQSEKELCRKVTDIIESIPDFLKFRYNLLEAIWYGRSANSWYWGWDYVRGEKYRTPAAWTPVHGDKLVFRYDDGRHRYDPTQIGIRVGAGIIHRYYSVWGEQINQVEPTDRALAYFLTRPERRCVAVHKHLIEDGAWEDPLSAGSIHGVGVRSRIYWTWLAMTECLTWALEYLERSAFGFEIWPYPQGNDEAEAATRVAAQERIGGGRSIILVPVVPNDDSGLYIPQHIEPGLGGVAELREFLTSYFAHKIKRYILGQVLTSEAESTGLGSGVADAHLATYADIIRFDAIGLQETLTRDLVRPIQLYNFPESRSCRIKFKIDTEEPDVQQRLQALEQAWNMGLKLKASDVAALVGASSPDDDDDMLQNPAFAQAELGTVDQGAQGLFGPNGGPVNTLLQGGGGAEAMQMSRRKSTVQGIEPLPGHEKYQRPELPVVEEGDDNKARYEDEIEQFEDSHGDFWVAYLGQRGRRGFQNTRTGEVRDEKPAPPKKKYDPYEDETELPGDFEKQHEFFREKLKGMLHKRINRFPGIDPADIENEADDAIVRGLKTFDPTKSKGEGDEMEQKKRHIMSIFNSRVLDLARKSKVSGSHEKGWSDDAPEPVADAGPDEDLLEEQQLKADSIREALKGLSEQDQQIFIANKVDGKSTRELKEEYGVSHTTIANSINRSTKAIQDHIAFKKGQNTKQSFKEDNVDNSAFNFRNMLQSANFQKRDVMAVKWELDDDQRRTMEAVAKGEQVEESDWQKLLDTALPAIEKRVKRKESPKPVKTHKGLSGFIKPRSKQKPFQLTNDEPVKAADKIVSNGGKQQTFLSEGGRHKDLAGQQTMFDVDNLPGHQEEAPNPARAAGSIKTTGLAPVGTHPGTMDESQFLKSSELSKARHNHYKDRAAGQGSRQFPMFEENFPIGSWKIDDDFEGIHGRDIEQLIEIDPAELETPEGDYTDEKFNPEGRGWDARRYAEWIKEGKTLPPIDVIQTEGGKLRVSDGHRRTAAAKLAGVPIRAWVSYTVDGPSKDYKGDPIPTGLTDKLARQQLRESRRSDEPTTPPTPASKLPEKKPEPGGPKVQKSLFSRGGWVYKPMRDGVEIQRAE